MSQIEENERTWLINKVGLIENFEGPEECESQKYAVAAWKLFREIVKSPAKSVSLNEGRNVIGNPRYLQQLDHDGIIMIDNENNVKPDSQISCNYFEDFVNKKDFDKILNRVERKLAEVEKEERKREIVWSNSNKRRWWNIFI